MKKDTRYEALKSIYLLNSRMSWMHKVQGVDISRCFEYTEAYMQLASIDHCKHILDIGTYRSPFPVFLVQQGYQVSIVDIDKSVARQRKWICKAVGHEARVSIIVGDGICLPFSASSFPGITCISTIEHLPGEGDMRMAREIGRVLQSGGYCFLSVPYMVTATEGRWGKWFQRWYDIPTAVSRLVKPSGLHLVSYGFLMGGMIGKAADVWYALPRLVRHFLSWFHFFLFPAAFEKDSASQWDARVLWLLLQK
ncbi:methyltransferase domain-containing protein [Thermanaerothrix sp.]|uniref:class I SAM-dependent methyltransferase n=1 Tax=Thermanaerothrix sp. TaxID=2972675 RepID=UPI003C799703